MTKGDERQKRYHRRHPDRRLIEYARRRAKNKGLPFNLCPSDISIPPVCPALGIPLRVAEGTSDDSSPTLDRVSPALGYVPGNVIVVSNLCNRIKGSATVEQIQQVATFYKRLTERTND